MVHGSCVFFGVLINMFYEFVARVSGFVVVCVCVLCTCFVPYLHIAHYLVYERSMCVVCGSAVGVCVFLCALRMICVSFFVWFSIHVL